MRVSEAGELLAVLDLVAATFARLEIVYCITGSLASGVHGTFRATNDLDLVAALETRQIQPLIDALAAEFVGDTEQARHALASNTGFNLIHRTTFLKVDIFPCASPFDHELVGRADVITLPGIRTPVRVATREDILLAKLRWYRLGGETSEVQRRDLQGLIALNRGEFDEPYLRAWARRLGVDDLLEQFLAE